VSGVAFTILFGFVPAPPSVIDAVQEIQVESSTEMASVFRLRLGIAQTALGDWTILQEDFFRPLLPVGIRISNSLGIPEALINGFVSGQRVNYSGQPGGSVLEVTGMDATLLMNLQEKVLPWTNMPDSGIAAAIFGQYAIVPRVQPTALQLVEPEGATTQRGTDIRFLRRLARRNGFECYVQPEPLSGLDQGFFQPQTLTGVPQAVLNVNMGPETNVVDFNVDYDMTAPTTAVAAGIDVTTKAVQPALAPASLQLPMGIEPSLLRVIPPPVVRAAYTGLMRTGELQPAVQSIVDRSSFALVAEGTLDARFAILRPGGIVNVRGLGRVFNGSYYLTRVAHTINREGHTQRFTARRNAVQMSGAELFVEI
jgi:phage protein D